MWHLEVFQIFLRLKISSYQLLMVVLFSLDLSILQRKIVFLKCIFLRLLYEFSQFSPFFVGAESVFKFTLKRPAAQHYVSYH